MGGDMSGWSARWNIHPYDERDQSDLSHHGPKFTCSSNIFFFFQKKKKQLNNRKLYRAITEESSDRSERQLNFIITEIII